jgi:DNA transformation protein and related proteins
MSADLDWFRELLGSLGPISVRRMFGGAGFYADGRMIALEADGSLYLKVDEQTRARFAEAGGSPFVYEGKGKSVVMSYWTVPDEAMDSAEAMRPWATLALEAAWRVGAAKKTATKKSVTKKASTESAARKTSMQAQKPAARKAATKKAAGAKKSAEKVAKKATKKATKKAGNKAAKKR